MHSGGLEYRIVFANYVAIVHIRQLNLLKNIMIFTIPHVLRLELLACMDNCDLNQIEN